jgi:hypothetical protein
MFDSLVVNSWVGIHDGCAITHSVGGSDSTHFTATGNTQSFEFSFQSEALRRFVERGVEALAEMDALAAREDVERGTGDARGEAENGERASCAGRSG